MLTIARCKVFIKTSITILSSYVLCAWSLLSISITLSEEFPHLRIVIEGYSFEFPIYKETDDR
jgi:hypothetical protein